MPSLNNIALIGNLTRDPELRVTPKGTSVCQFGLAINRQIKDDSGASRDETTFVDIEAWGKTADVASKYLQKGNPVALVGHLKSEQWEDKQSGQKRSKLKVVVDSLTLLSDGRGRQGGASSKADDEPHEERRAAESLPMQRSTPRPPAPSTQDKVDDDVPF